MTNTEIRYAMMMGADMAPAAIRQRPETANGQFAGIGAVRAPDIADPDLPLPATPEVWGVVMRLPAGTALRGRTVPVTLRTGEQVDAIVLTGADALSESAAVLAEAAYWELPVAYRDALYRLTQV